MIKKIEIKNFESHTHTIYDNLSSGLNLFRGESDSGKSSAFRAISVCAYNKWNEEMLRIGEKRAEIIIETDKGKVKTVRGGGKNEWTVSEYLENGEVKDYFFEKVGKTVPEVVTKILGMPKLEIAGVKETPNMMFQLDKHYMISEVDGKKCSSNMIAQIVDEVLGLTGTEKLINDINLDGKRAKREAKENGEQIEQLKINLHDEEKIKEKKQILSDCQILYKEYEKKSERIKNINEMRSRLNYLYGRQIDVNEILKSYKDIKDQLKQYDNLREKYIQYKQYGKLYEQLKTTENKIVMCKKRIEQMPDFTNIEVELDGLLKLYKKYEKMTLFYKDYESSFKKLERIRNSYKIASSEFEEVKKQWDEFRKENPNCPVCGSLLKEEVCC